MRLVTTPLAVALARPWPTTRRGFKLWLIALLLGVKGVGLLAGFGTTTSDTALVLFTQTIEALLPGPVAAVLPVTTRAVGLCIVLMCAAAAFFAYCHHGRDRYGYNLVAAVAAAWVGVFITAPFSGAPWSAIQGALSYGLVYAFVVYSASDPDDSIKGPDTAPQCGPGTGPTLLDRARARLWRRAARWTR